MIFIPRPDACAAEAMSFPRGAKAIASISLAWGILIAVLESKRIPLVTAHPKTWRRAICRSGSEADSHAAAMALVPSYADFESSIVKGQLWVPCIDSGTVVVVDPASMKIVRELPAGEGPIVALPMGGHVWVSHTTGTSLWRL